jgi:heavy metal translocating P-type ATPase
MFGNADDAHLVWSAGAAPVVLALGVAIIRDFLAGRMGVDAVALVSMSAALVLGESLAAIVVAVMYAGGNVLEDFAVGRAERNLRMLVDRAPRIAHRMADGAVETVPIGAVSLGDRLLVRAGEVIPVDGIIASHAASLDESALTGEPIPVERQRGSVARSGTVNAGEAFEMDVSAVADDSTYAGIVRLANTARTTRSPFIRTADHYALILLPVSLAVAGAAWALSGDPIRGLAVLVVATPCPLILAAPVAFISGISQAARRGILVKGSGPLEALARARTAIFDKTGTLTVGGARIIAIETAPGQDPDELLGLAASLEQASQHIVANAITAAARQKGLELTTPTDITEAPGSGLEGTVRGRRVRAGSAELVLRGQHPDRWLARSLRRAGWRSALSVVVSIDGRVSGVLLLADQLRPESSRTIDRLRAAGITRVIMVSGDRSDAVESIGAALGLDAVLAERLPSEKVDAVTNESSLAPTLMIGDGINDAPALAAADVGIALGARGATASSEAADVVILVERLDRVADAIAIARRTRRIALQSIVVGLALSGIGMAAAAVGWLTPVAGALIQEVIDVAVILNALRVLRIVPLGMETVVETGTRTGTGMA